MKCQIRTKERCPKCRNRFEGNPLKCSTCLTTPRKFYVDIYEKGYGQLKIYSDKTGRPLDSFERANRVLEGIRYEFDQHIFDPTKYVAGNIEEFLFENQVEKWYKRKIKEVEKNILAESYTRKLRCYIDSYFLSAKTEKHGFILKGKDVREIRSSHVQEFYDQLPSGKSPKYVKNILTALASFFNALSKLDIISKSPNFPVITVDRKTPKGIDRSTQLKVLEAMALVDRPIISFMMAQGIRPCEAAALKVKDIHFSGEYFIIERAFSNRKLRERVKSKVVRPRAINPSIIPMLRELCTNKLPEAFLFINQRTGRPYTDSALFRLWDNVREKLKLDVNLYQATRHSLAINSKLDGSNLEDIGEVLGHTNPATTRIYAGVHILNQRRVLQKSQQEVSKDVRSQKE